MDLVPEEAGAGVAVAVGVLAVQVAGVVAAVFLVVAEALVEAEAVVVGKCKRPLTKHLLHYSTFQFHQSK